VGGCVQCGKISIRIKKYDLRDGRADEKLEIKGKINWLEEPPPTKFKSCFEILRGQFPS
jgi:hypothetical protein